MTHCYCASMLKFQTRFQKYDRVSSVTAELTLTGPGLDGDGALVRREGVVEQVDFTVHLCIYDHGVHYGAVTVHQQIMGAVLHGCYYSAQARDNSRVRKWVSQKWITGNGLGFG